MSLFFLDKRQQAENGRWFIGIFAITGAVARDANKIYRSLPTTTLPKTIIDEIAGGERLLNCEKEESAAT